jgi:toxin secretion/phage lysis holin
METLYKLLVSVPAAVFTFMFGDWHQMFAVFLALWAIDVVTGMVASGIEGKVSSIRGAVGIGKKVVILCIIAGAHLADSTLGTGDIIRNSALFFYIINEFVSILENVGRAGVPLPPKLEQAIEVLKSKSVTDKAIAEAMIEQKEEPPKAK